MDIDRTYLYKISRNGVYLGLLPNVVSDFSYKQEINTGAVQVQIDVNQSLDTADEAPPILITEQDGSWITTENGIPITAERSVEVIGNKDSGRLIAGFNDIEIVEISSDHPNGVTVFTGYISKWRASAGSQDITSITCISYGKELSDYIYGTNLYTLQLSQTTTSTGNSAVVTPTGAAGLPTAVAQSISGVTFNLSEVILSLCLDTGLGIGGGVTADITLKIYSGVDPRTGGTLLTSAFATITNTSFQGVTFILNNIVALTGGNYYFTIEATDVVDINGSFDSSNPYAGGQSLYYFVGAGAWYQNGTDDLYFKLYSSTAVVSDATYTGVDPGNMVKQAIDGYRAQGGVVAYGASTVDLAGYTLNYAFKLATILEIINKAKDLAPYDWYWYVDPATQILYFKETLTTATHKMIIGRHVENFSLEASVEEIINVVYFSGGPTAGVNLLKLYTNNPSLLVNRRGMNRLTDNRVTDATTASTLGQANINENNAEIFRTDPLTINANTYDISLFKPGDTLAFEGFGSFIDSLIFQITAVDRHPDYVGLTLGKLPLRSDFYVDQIRRDLDNEQTLANPTGPS